MTWVNFAILGVGGGLVSVPIILHFMMQPKPKPLAFPAMRFLKKMQSTNRTQMRLRHFLLLLFRCLLIALAALALAGPSVATNDFGNWLTLGGIGLSGLLVGGVLALAFFRRQKNWLLLGVLGALFLGHLVYGGWAASQLLGSDSARLIGDDQAPVAALIVIDTSPRMDYRSENQTRLEKAQELARWLLTQFPLDSQVCVMATDGDTPFFSVDVPAADRRIETLEIEFSGNTIPATVNDGFDLLSKASQERKELYIITDMTEQSWAGENPNLLLKKLNKQEETSVYVLDVGIENPMNFSLGELTLAESEIMPGGQLSVNTSVQRVGPAEQRSVTMSIEKPTPPLPVIRDGAAVFPETTFAPQTVTKDIRENSSVDANFTFGQELAVGTYHGKVSIEGSDGLPVDDERFFTFRVSEKKQALIVHAEGVEPAVLEAILAPSSRPARFNVEVIEQAKLSNIESLKPFDSVYLLDPAPLGDANWARLEAYVRQGGGLGVFLGYNATQGVSAHPDFTSPAAQRLLTGRLDKHRFDDSDDLFLSPGELSHPIFQLIRLQPTNVLWNRFSIKKYWSIEPDESEETEPTQTLLSFGNREPAVRERAIGAGRVIVMTTPITEYGYVEGRDAWNRLFVLTNDPVPGFLLLRGITSYLAQSDVDSLNIEIGEVATFENDLREFPESYFAFSPQPEKPPTTVNANESKIRFKFTDRPGQYRLKEKFDGQGELLLRGFSVNVPPAATNLTRLQLDQLDSFLGADRYQLARERTELERQQGTQRRGQEFYPLIVLMIAVMMAVEYLMSNRFYAS